MSRQRLPRLGAGLLRALATETCSGGAAAGQRAVPGAACRAYATALVRDGASTAAAVLRRHPGGALQRALPGGSSGGASLRAFAAAAAADLPPHQELSMPALSPTMTQGNIISWKKKEGDAVAPGDIFCEVETDKATIEWEAQEEGYVAKILMPAGSNNIPLGTPVAILVEEEGDVAAFKDYTPGAAPAAAAAPAAEAKPKGKKGEGKKKKPAGGASFPPHVVMAMPALSPTMSVGNIVSWKKREGDEVAAGEILAEVETDKSTMEWEAQDDGVVAKLLVPEGAQGIAVGAPVMVMVDESSAVPAFASFSAEDAAGGGAAAAAAAAEEEEEEVGAPAAAAAPKAAPSAPGARLIASPYAKRLAAEAGVGLAGVGGSGPHGRIVAADVQALLASGGGAPAAAAGAHAAAPAAAGEYASYTDIPNTQIRKITAQRLLESKQQIPHYYLTISCRIDALGKLRQQLNDTLAATDGGKLSVNDFIVKASALSLKKVPEVNASWHGEFIRQYNNVDCSIAVQTPIGLMVPIVRDADKKGLAAIAGEVKELAGRAKDGKLQPAEFTGGTFTISNLGMFGISQFAAIVNPPQACILAVGGTEKRVVAAPGGGFEEASYMQATLSCDHRVVDGAVGARWLQAFKSYVESPATMLL